MTYEQFRFLFVGFALGFAVCNFVWCWAWDRRSKKPAPGEYDAEKHSRSYPFL